MGYSYDDIIKPKLSIVKSRSEIKLHTKISKCIFKNTNSIFKYGYCNRR